MMAAKPKPVSNDLHRRSIRLKGYDYSIAGAYFVTICTQSRLTLFGDIVEGVIDLNDAGRMVATALEELPARHPFLVLGTFVVMPNHIHGILIIESRDTADPVNRVGAPLVGAHGTVRVESLGEIVGGFKSMTTVSYVQAADAFGWPRFPGRLWQRNYWEHVLRDDQALARAREYVTHNPLRWQEDPENPARSM